MISNKVGYGYNDLTIVPSILSSVKSRSEVNPFDKNGNLPIFTAPMSSVVNCENFKLWKKNGIIPILPRNIDWKIRYEYFKNHEWVAVSLSESNEILTHFKNHILNFTDTPYYLCIDVANGHMEQLIDISRELKEFCGDNLKIMTGNIANPATFTVYMNAEIDYVRCGIGGGSQCTTSSNTAIHYPQASLIDEIYSESLRNRNIITKIVADGGIRNFSDVIKALALGANYVMVGGLFASFLESAGELKIPNHSYEITEDNKFKIWDSYETLLNVCKSSIKKQWGQLYHKVNPEYICKSISNLYDGVYIIDLWNENTSEEVKRKFIELNPNMTKQCFGMSTKEAQKLIKDKSSLKTAEGKTSEMNIKYTIKQWRDNMESYLRSAMSYCGKLNLEYFIGKVDLIPNSSQEIYAVNK